MKYAMTLNAFILILLCLFKISEANEEMDEYSELFKEWTVFTHVDSSWLSNENLLKIPDSLPGVFGEVQPSIFSSEDKTINLGHSIDFEEYDLAIFYANIHSTKDTTLIIGASADWWMTWYHNGAKEYNTFKPKGFGGNRTTNYKPTDHSFEIHLTEGDNIIAVAVYSGSQGWRLVADVLDDWPSMFGTTDNGIFFRTSEESFSGPRSLAMLMPFLAIILVMLGLVLIIVLPFYFKYRRHKIEHQTMIKYMEAGKALPSGMTTVYEKKKSKKNVMLRDAINNIALGLGLILCLSILINDSSIWSIGFIPLLIGMGKWLIWKLESPPKDLVPSNRDEGI